MNKSAIFILPATIFLVFLCGCSDWQSGASNNKNRIAAKTANNINQNVFVSGNENSYEPAETIKPINDKSSDGNEIKSCSPEKLYRGDILTVKFNQPHSGYSAILRMSDGKWFFLDYAEKSTPLWSVETLKTLSEIKINPETAVNTTNSEKPEKIFNKTEKYRIMISDQDFGQDDPPVTGICIVEYVNEQRPQK